MRTNRCGIKTPTNELGAIEELSSVITKTEEKIRVN